MSAKVIPLGDDILVPGSRLEDVEEVLRDLLAQAERGEIAGIGYVAVDPAGTVTCDWKYQGAAIGFVLTGAVARLLYRMNRGQD